MTAVGFVGSHVVPYSVTMDSTARVSSSSMLLLFMMVHGGGSILLLPVEVVFQSSIAWKFLCVMCDVCQETRQAGPSGY